MSLLSLFVVSSFFNYRKHKIVFRMPLYVLKKKRKKRMPLYINTDKKIDASTANT